MELRFPKLRHTNSKTQLQWREQTKAAWLDKTAKTKQKVTNEEFKQT